MINKEPIASFFSLCRVGKDVTVKVVGNGRKRSFTIDENVIREEIYALLSDVDSAYEEYIAKEEIQPEKDTQDTSIITPEANTHVVLTDPPNEESKKKDKKQKEEVDK